MEIEHELGISIDEYKIILDNISNKAGIDDMDIWFLDIYDYLEKIKKQDLMPYVLNDLKKMGFEIIFNKTFFKYGDYGFSSK
ncbi:MAG: hypothetical protein Q8N99_08840 [Nanoarchaeota archaeon]|nr:hypothetical protein [Nanoarchaeota archaeon]